MLLLVTAHSKSEIDLCIAPVKGHLLFYNLALKGNQRIDWLCHTFKPQIASRTILLTFIFNPPEHMTTSNELLDHIKTGRTNMSMNW